MLDLDAVIEHWVRTVRSGRVVHRCGSAEGGYRPALGEVEILDDDPPRQVVPLDVRLGWAAESAWRRIASRSARILLSRYYVRGYPPIAACRAARLDSRRFGAVLATGRRQMRDYLLRTC